MRERRPINGLRNQLRGAGVLCLCVVLTGLAACHPPEAPGSSLALSSRETIHLAPEERQRLRAGMLRYLSATQAIADALATNKVSTIPAIAGEVGMDAVKDVSVLSTMKLPPQFVLLAADTHNKFDELAEAAAQKATTQKLLGLLRDIMANCSACHQSYQVTSP